MLRALILAAGVALLVSEADAAGINLGWSDCGATADESFLFACDTNAGTPAELFGSFIPAAGVDQYVGFQARLSVISSEPTMPDWWRFGASECRGTSALAMSSNFTSGPFTCMDVFQGAAYGTLATHTGASPNISTITISAEMSDPTPVDPSLEYYAFRMSVGRSKSTGSSACAGCAKTVCIVLDYIQLYQSPEGGFDPRIDNPVIRNYAVWQDGSYRLHEHDSPECLPPIPTGARAPTWGSIKSLYR